MIRCCIVCGETRLSMFYAGVTNLCAEHWRDKVKEHRELNADHYKAYDAARANRPDRVEARAKYAATPEGRAARARANKAWRQRNKQKLSAHNAVSKALLRGKIKRQPCEQCQSQKAEAHHEDYSKPLVIRWLCDKHHKERHKQMFMDGIEP